jgi:hypothetical protein
MPFIQRDEAERIIKPYFDDFAQVVKAAWKDWMAGAYASQMQHKRVRANCVWNQLLAHAKRRFEGKPSVRVETMKNWDGVLVDDKVFVRMTKGTQDLLSRNFPTQAALAFHDTMQDLFGGIARLELLYVLDKAETEIERIVLVQRHKKSVAWFIDILGEEGAATQSVMPLVPLQPEGSPADRMIKPKEGSKRNGNREPKRGS